MTEVRITVTDPKTKRHVSWTALNLRSAKAQAQREEAVGGIVEITQGNKIVYQTEPST